MKITVKKTTAMIEEDGYCVLFPDDITLRKWNELVKHINVEY